MSGRDEAVGTSTELYLDRDGLVGTYTRAARRSGAAAVVIGGSGGGSPGDGYGPALARRGVDSLALVYFGARGLPDALTSVPLEYVERALTWVTRRPGVDPGRVSIVARSRGTEAAQLVAVRRPDLVAGLVLGVPTCVVVQAWPGDGAAWTASGAPIPYHPDGWPAAEELADDPTSVIPIEQFAGPVLTVAGGRDQTWPSEAFAGVIARRRSGLPTTTLVYPDAVHAVGRLLPDEEPGDTLADVAARTDAWPRAVAHVLRCGAGG